jgi:hypothetical protein
MPPVEEDSRLQAGVILFLIILLCHHFVNGLFLLLLVLSCGISFQLLAFCFFFVSLSLLITQDSLFDRRSFLSFG